MDVIEDVIKSLYHQGFKRFLILNGHGGNEPLKGRLFELVNELSELRLSWYSWWQSKSVERIALKHEIKPYHGGWLEAFPFNIVANLPDGEKQPSYIPGLIGAIETKKLFGDGVFGGLYKVSNEIMDEMFDALVEDVVQILLTSLK
jgi:creatinine amidohydrolase